MSINATRGIHCNIGMWWSTIGRHKLLQIKISLMKQRRNETSILLVKYRLVVIL